MQTPSAWISLDERDGDPARFITYLIAALQKVKPGTGEGLLAILQSPQPLQIDNIMTMLINEIASIPDDFVIVLDDYHALDSLRFDKAMEFLIDHQPVQMHLVIATREDPDLPLARLRGRGQCIELRAADLRFTNNETAEYFNRIMKLGLSKQDIDALETRTEGWIVGLQMAAISLKDLPDTESFIQSFTGSHRFIMDYLLEEVLNRQPVYIQTFLQKTSILERMCGSLCDTVLQEPTGSCQSILEYLERVNFFIIPQDNERRWYRYHHLFANLLRQQLAQRNKSEKIAMLNILASEWFDNNDMTLDAFQHAVAANDIERAIRLMESKKMPLHRRGSVTLILDWLKTLPETARNAQPVLWWKQAALMLEIGQTIGVEEKLKAAEAALEIVSDEKTRSLTGKIALARATLALNQFEIETILLQVHRALEYLNPDDFPYRSSATLTMGNAYYLRDELDEAGQAYAKALLLAQAGGDIANIALSTLRLGIVQANSCQLHQAAKTCWQVLELIGEYSPSNAALAYIELANINYAWNNLDAAEKFLEQGSQLARQYAHVVDRAILCDLYMARLKLAQGDMSGAERIVLQAERDVREKNIHIRLPDLFYCLSEILLRQGDLDAASQLARKNDFPLMQARVLIAQGNPSAALEVTEASRQQAEAKKFPERLLHVLAVQSVVLFTNGDKDKAIQVLTEALALAEPGSYVRLFIDEGTLMAQLLREAASHGIMLYYTEKLLAAFEAEKRRVQSTIDLSPANLLIDPLSPRELEILKLIAQGLSNQGIGKRLFLALDTVKGHNRHIFEKLQVQRRTEAIARARELGLI